MAEKFVLTLTPEHARVVRDACELLMRLKMGQSWMPVDALMPIESMKDTHEYCIRRDCARASLDAALTMIGLKPAVGRDEDTNLAYEVWGTIRYTDWKAHHGDGDSWCVESQPPLKETEYDMPVCEVKEDGRAGKNEMIVNELKQAYETAAINDRRDGVLVPHEVVQYVIKLLGEQENYD